ncbi:UDP-N-acetylmuramoyl-tripeptide--D-alanyl-D-alanine ligase [Actibacterium sp. 188UL27-1]|uniref:UDP-N-acetylmuramoyl-tripeptide--D-alanyl-D- alanine ligase n=1 Tax=Actibacterium sp. 188UL27-1 TaxID=2786961 RepID=UPI00195621FA|nr:UDP-N-acetylmuramoyl-tripeptide--D-alanyl-D-alanine ligase [Actibacterium sp. 188UL27-1]
MTPLWTSTTAAEATGGQAFGDWEATGVSIDTRTLQSGDLFVALADIRDGHDFVADALANGAAAALVSKIPDGVADTAPLLIVADVLRALEDLGQAARARMTGKVIGVTGSVGKTSTKEMLRAMLTGQGHVHAAEKSYNNHWGVPLTLARMPADTDYAVIEIGMNHPGEIAPLARLADLDAAMITTVAAAHLEAFGSIEGIAHEKAAIMDGLRPGGAAVLNADLPTSEILFDKARRTSAQPIGFGETAGQARLLDVRLVERRTIARAAIEGQQIVFKLSSAGRHFAQNALGALAMVQAVGADLGRAVVALGHWQPVDGRGVSERLILDEIDPELAIDLIDDAYNANPASVGAALDMLAATRPLDDVGRIARGRRIAVLGDMLELGPTEGDLHAALATHPSMKAVTTVHCVGSRTKALWEALPPHQRGRAYKTADKLAAEMPRLLDAGDVVLVKGSLGIGLKVVVDAIRKLGHPA